jgi:phosphinothricin acetyltransferase
MGFFIREATADDLTAINDIYNYYVRHATCTWQLEPEPMAARQAWFAAHGPAHPVTVAVSGGRVVGWGSLSPYNPRAGYRHTVENSLYVHPEQHRRGIGRALLADLIARAQARRYRTLIAGVAADQPASLALHEALGFERVAHLRQVGHKFDRWHDLFYLQKML